MTSPGTNPARPPARLHLGAPAPLSTPPDAPSPAHLFPLPRYPEAGAPAARRHGPGAACAEEKLRGPVPATRPRPGPALPQPREAAPSRKRHGAGALSPPTARRGGGGGKGLRWGSGGERAGTPGRSGTRSERGIQGRQALRLLESRRHGGAAAVPDVPPPPAPPARKPAPRSRRRRRRLRCGGGGCAPSMALPLPLPEAAAVLAALLLLLVRAALRSPRERDGGGGGSAGR